MSSTEGYRLGPDPFGSSPLTATAAGHSRTLSALSSASQQQASSSSGRRPVTTDSYTIIIMYVYRYMYRNTIYIYIYILYNIIILLLSLIYIYIYICIERERERNVYVYDNNSSIVTASGPSASVGLFGRPGLWVSYVTGVRMLREGRSGSERSLSYVGLRAFRY